MAKFDKRLKALTLRREGKSIRSIAMKLNVSKASVSVWCRDLELTWEQKKRLLENAIKGGHLGRVKGALVNHEKKLARIQFHKDEARKIITSLSPQEFLVAGTALYWAEGSRKSKFAFTNSEPHMVKFMHRWMKDHLNVKQQEFMPRIFISEVHELRLAKVISFWSDLLNLPRSQFGKPVLLKGRPKKVYENHDTYYGILALGVRRSSELKYRVLGLIDSLKIAPV